METVIDNLGNPIFGAFIFLLLVLIVVRQAIVLIARPYLANPKVEERTSTRLGLLAGIGVAILIGSWLFYAVSPSVRDDFAFLRSGVGQDNDSLSNVNETCFKRILCYDMQAARLRCADPAADFKACMADRLGARLSGYEENCGDLGSLFDEARASNLQCIFRNTASVLFSASAKIHRAIGSR